MERVGKEGQSSIIQDRYQKSASVLLLIYSWFQHCFSTFNPFCSRFPNFQSVVLALGFIPKLPELETRAQSTEFIRPSHCNQCSRDNSENLNQFLCDFTCLAAHLLTPSAMILGLLERQTRCLDMPFKFSFIVVCHFHITVKILQLSQFIFMKTYFNILMLLGDFQTILSHLLTLN